MSSVCRYYLRGDCRYGDSCRFSHSNTQQTRPYHPPAGFDMNHDSHRSTRPSYKPEFRFVAPTAPAQNHRSDSRRVQHYAQLIQWVRSQFADGERTLDILQQLQKEARVWLKSASLWRFTSRSIFPGGQPLPDWSDMSFEEVKWNYYLRTALNQQHLYKTIYNEYWENTERFLVQLSKLEIKFVTSLKPYLDQCLASQYQPSTTLTTDVEMSDGSGTNLMTMATNTNAPRPLFSIAASNNYTPDDVLLEDERAAFQSNTFEIGQIPIHAPSQNFR